MEEITAQNLESIINSNDVVLVDVWAGWCGSCKSLMPTMDAIAKEMQGKAKIVKIDIEANPSIASEFGIKSLPTLLYFKAGSLVQMGGVTGKQQIITNLKVLAQ